MKKILIIGGSKGIGKATIEQLKPTHQIINFSRTNPVSDVNVTHHQIDILNDELPEIDDISGLVYCPGSINLKPIGRLSLDDFRSEFEINVLGAVKAIQKYANTLKRNNGSVVLFSTVASQMGMPFHSSIAASKSAVEGLTKSLAAEYATKIRFNCIAPTVTQTSLSEKLLRNEKQVENMINRHPLKKYLQPTEVAKLVTYLLSDDATSLSGQVFKMDAGIVTLKL